MGKHLRVSLILIVLLFLLPWLWGAPVVAEPPAEEVPEPQEEIGQEMVEQPPDSKDAGRLLRVLIGGKLQEMDMETYLQGVVRAEMPASFEPEALKAQAVAARTYTLYKMAHGSDHPEADACDDITCCKAYMSGQKAAALWGEQAEVWEEKICAAVAETDGECVLYEGKPILAVFHSSSAGMTQDAVNVWSSSLPYLQSVQSPESGETVPNYHSQAVFQTDELKTVLREALPGADLSETPSAWFTNMKQQENGTVTSLCVGGVPVGGNELRTILGLRSACFTISFAGDAVTFSVTGYGHGVGMSQYGANVLAQEGKTYREILAWYYVGTEVGDYEG